MPIWRLRAGGCLRWLWCQQHVRDSDSERRDAHPDNAPRDADQHAQAERDIVDS